MTESPAASSPGAVPSDPAEAPLVGGASAGSTDPDDLAPRPRRAEMSSFELAAVVQEMQSLVDGHLDKAYQPTRNEVLLRFRAKGLGRRDLFIRRGGFVCLTENTPENPIKPPGFAMALRKYVCGGRVVAITQAGFDRVFTIEVQRREGLYRIVVELFGDGNCILVRPDGNILVPLVPESWASRTVRSGHPYQEPPPRIDPLVLDEAGFIAAARDGNRDLVRALAIQVGLGGPLAEELVLRTGVDKDAAIDAVGDDDLGALFSAWDDLRRRLVEGRREPVLLRENGRAVDASADHSLRFEAMGARPRGGDEAADAGFTVEPVPSFSAALDTLHLSGRQAAERAELVKGVEQRATRLQRQIDAQHEAIERFERETAQKGVEGELVFAHYQTVQQILEQLREARKTLDWTQIEERLDAGRAAGNEDASRIVRLRPDSAEVVVRLENPDGGSLEVPLDLRLDVNENANAAYERAKKARAKLAGAREALASTEQKAAVEALRHDEASAAVDAAMVRSSLRVTAMRHFWFEGFRWFFASTGELVVAGRDAATNDKIVKKHLEDSDRYIHADLHGAPSTVVKHVNGDVSETALLEAAQAAVTFSRAFGRFGSGDAYWVTPPQVSKTPQPGEFLARGAFIVRGERQWFRKLSLDASLGVVALDDQGRPRAPQAQPDEGPGEADDGAPEEEAAVVAKPPRPKMMAGPPHAVHAWSDQWVDLVAGDGPRKAFVQALANAFSAAPDVVDRALPVGDLRIVGTRGLDAQALAALSGLPGGPKPTGRSAEDA